MKMKKILPWQITEISLSWCTKTEIKINESYFKIKNDLYMTITVNIKIKLIQNINKYCNTVYK